MTATTTDVRADEAALRGARAYTPAYLRIYDAFVLRFAMRVWWRCPKSELVALYDRYGSANHLDVGVGTGTLLKEWRKPAGQPRITLADLNENTLRVASKRLKGHDVETRVVNVLEPIDLPERSYDSIGICLLLHCVPGPMREKGPRTFAHLGPLLSEGGTLFGATILAKGVEHGFVGRRALKPSNKSGIFDNLDDSLDDLRAALAGAFAEHEVWTRGSTALFHASGFKGGRS